MEARSDIIDLAKARGAADTFLVIDDHLRESIGLAQREGWAVLAYLLSMAREQLQDDLRRDVGLGAKPGGAGDTAASLGFRP